MFMFPNNMNYLFDLINNICTYLYIFSVSIAVYFYFSRRTQICQNLAFK